MGYSVATTICLLSHLYDSYMRISATGLEENERNLRKPCNTNETLKSLYMRLKKWVDNATAVGEPITEEQVVRISYSLVAEMGQFQEDFRTWCAKSESEKS